MRLPLLLGGVAVLGLGALVLSKKNSNGLTVGQPASGSGNDLSGQRALTPLQSQQLDAFFGNYVGTPAKDSTDDDTYALLVGTAPAPGSTTDGGSFVSSLVRHALGSKPDTQFYVPSDVAGAAALGDASKMPASPMILFVRPNASQAAKNALQAALSQGWFRYTPSV